MVSNKTLAKWIVSDNLSKSFSSPEDVDRAVQSTEELLSKFRPTHSVGLLFLSAFLGMLMGVIARGLV